MCNFIGSITSFAKGHGTEGIIYDKVYKGHFPSGMQELSGKKK